ncbi:Protein ssh4 [Kickxella alabastrina]|uniref:Protein ssh4 n=1 Tax=Kickxella alabastrina TaxID=61397 RepID=A0ACC1IH31_9FUNG|nr:Protein ssh4 [Kickxella alabastrina]
MASTKWLLVAATAATSLGAWALQGAIAAPTTNHNFDAWGHYTTPLANVRLTVAEGEGGGEDDELVTILILVVALFGALFGVGALFLLFYVCSLVVRQVRGTVFGMGEDGVSERLRRQLLTDDDSRQSYEMGRAFEQQYPYGSINTQLTDEQQAEIREKGVDAWEFVVDLDVNAMLQSKTEVLFMGGENCVQTNLPLPKINSVYYFEVKIVEKPVDVNMWIGLATKPYPAWRMTGWNKYSVGFCANNGSVHQNSPFKGTRIGEQLFVGDILGIGFQPRSGVVWFTRNGRRYKAISSGMLYDVFPTISADGPCSFSANFGQRGFVFIEANVKRWGFGPIEGAMLPPPIYGANQNTILLETAVASSESEDDDGGSDESESISISTPESTAVLEGSVAIDISSTAASVEALVPHPSSSRRQRRRQPGKNRPPHYEEEDPIAAQLLEAGETSLEPVVTYRNKQPDLLHSQDSESMGFDAAGQFALNPAGSSSQLSQP